MGVVYEDKPHLEEEGEDEAKKSKVAPIPKSKGVRKVAGKRKPRELEDMRIGQDLTKPVRRKGRKVTFYLGGDAGETSESKDQLLVSFSTKVNLDSCFRLTLIPVSLYILGVFLSHRLSLVEYLCTQGLLNPCCR